MKSSFYSCLMLIAMLALSFAFGAALQHEYDTKHSDVYPEQCLSVCTDLFEKFGC